MARLAELIETKTWRTVLGSILGLLFFISFLIDWNNVAQGGSIDLRNRVTGARLLLAHVDPYFYKWYEPEPAPYCDPYNNPHLPVSKTTASPTMLALGMPTAALPYRIGQFVWLVIEWACLLGTLALWFPLFPTPLLRALFVFFAASFTYTAAWRLHAERGQTYVLILLLLGFWRTRCLTGKSEFLLGAVAGLLAGIRLPFLLLSCYMLQRRRRQLPGFLFGLLVALILPLIWNGNIWSDYGRAMQAHSTLYRDGIDPKPGPEHFPATIEGMPTDLLANYAPIPYADFSFHALMRSLGFEPLPAFPPLILGGVGCLGWLWWRRNHPLQVVLAGLTAWLFLLDLLLPAYRNIYNDILCLNLVASSLVLVSVKPWPSRFFFLALPIGWAVDFFAPMHDWLIDLPSACVAAGAVALLF